MSVLVKGISMPKEGNWITLRVFPDGQCFFYSWCGNDFDFMEHLTAVPVPPHGDLIDRDALMQQIEHDTPLSAVFEKTMRRYLHNAPTIIPAEED